MGLPGELSRSKTFSRISGIVQARRHDWKSPQVRAAHVAGRERDLAIMQPFWTAKPVDAKLGRSPLLNRPESRSVASSRKGADARRSGAIARQSRAASPACYKSSPGIGGRVWGEPALEGRVAAKHLRLETPASFALINEAKTVQSDDALNTGISEGTKLRERL